MITNIYGAGPAGLMAAEVLAAAGRKVLVHDHMPSPARKFLLAGRGGLNLTHSEPIETFLEKYGDARPRLEPAIRNFPPEAVREWSHSSGIETFVGSSGRIFPKPMKASPLLRAWLRRLDDLGVEFAGHSPWPGFDGTPCVLAFGGASWPNLGSNAKWVDAFADAGIDVTAFAPANNRQSVPWTEHFALRFAGTPVKNVALEYAGAKARGEIMISRDGVEGGAIYALSQALRAHPGEMLKIDLRPELTEEAVATRFQKKRSKDSQSNFLRKAFNLPPAAIALMRETHAKNPKQVTLQLKGPAPIARAISSAGGVAWAEIDEKFQLRKKPGVFVAGEMLDWQAPTGGYLLQACFATGAAAAKGLLSL